MTAFPVLNCGFHGLIPLDSKNSWSCVLASEKTVKQLMFEYVNHPKMEEGLT